MGYRYMTSHVMSVGIKMDTSWTHEFALGRLAYKLRRAMMDACWADLGTYDVCMLDNIRWLIMHYRLTFKWTMMYVFSFCFLYDLK